MHAVEMNRDANPKVYPKEGVSGRRVEASKSPRAFLLDALAGRSASAPVNNGKAKLA